jgi:DNA-binding MarR family transcriptional regulator
LRRAWVGYQRRLDDELAAAGFGERRFPDGRVLRICSDSDAMTIAQIGRELGITRQGASKIVASLRDRRYVTVSPSTEDGREKIVQLTPWAVDYLAAQRKAARAIERRLRTEIGTDSLESLYRLLDALGGDQQPRMSDYLRE